MTTDGSSFHLVYGLVLGVVLDRLTAADFEDTFKGVFEQQTIPEEDIDAVVAFLRDQQRHLDTEQ